MAKTRTSGSNGGGRPKGSKNSISEEIKKDLIAVYKEKKGKIWLKGLPDDQFLKLFSKLVPQAVEGDFNVSGNITVVIEKLGEK